MFVCVCGSVTMITRNSVHHLYQTESVGEGSDHLQLIKFWPSLRPREGGLRRGENFWLRLTKPTRSVCVSPSTSFPIYFCCQCPRLCTVSHYRHHTCVVEPCPFNYRQHKRNTRLRASCRRPDISESDSVGSVSSAFCR